MNRTIIIRQALVADALNVHAVLLAAKDDIPLRCPFETDHYRAWARQECRNRSVWIAEIGGKLAGVMVMAGAEMFYLATVAKYRRRGVGRTLVRQAINITKRRHRSGVTVEVWEKNKVVIKLLEKEGFKPLPKQAPKPHALVADRLPAWVVYLVGDAPKEPVTSTAAGWI